MTTLVAPSRASTQTRILPLDALRGLALLCMALDHAAAAVQVSFQAETYGGQPAILLSAAYWVTGLITNIAAPAFWLLSGVSVALLEAGQRRNGASESAITRFLLIRAAVLAALTLTVCDWAWLGKTPYTQVLLSLSLSLAALNLLRRLPLPVLGVGLAVVMLGYQAALPWIAQNFSQADSLWRALLLGYSTVTRPAVEFSLLGWGPLMGVGYLLGRNIHQPRWQAPRTWLALGGALIALALVLRAWGGFGDLAPAAADAPWYYFLVLSKQPPSLTFFALNLGLAALILAGLYAGRTWLERWPGQGAVVLGQVALFSFVVHIVVYNLVGRVFLALALPVPGVIVAYLAWGCGLAVLFPLAFLYRRLRRQNPKSVLRYL